MDKPDFKFRKAKLADIDVLASMVYQLNVYEAAVDSLLGTKIEKMSSIKKSLLDNIKNKDARIFVAQQDNDLIAYILGFIEKGPDYLSHKYVGYIESCWVEKDHRKKGVAKKLIEILLDSFRKKKISFVSLGVLTKNAASKKTWSKLGFEEYYVKMRKYL